MKQVAMVAPILSLIAAMGCGRPAPPPQESVSDRGTIRHSVTRAAHWLIQNQDAQGGWPEGTASTHPGVTALVRYALESLPPEVKPAASEAAARARTYLITTMGKDGAMGVLGPDRWEYPNYTTALHLMTSDGPNDPAVGYLKKAQLDEDEGWKPEEPEYGGWDYGRPNPRMPFRLDISVTAFALEALKAAGVPAADPVWAKAGTFLSRCQNLDGDGGFFFSPAKNKAGETVGPDGARRFNSYGSATCDGLRSLLAAGCPKDDRRVQAAYRWIRDHYTMEINPGFSKDDPDGYARGVYYYYLFALAKALAALGDDTLATPDGIRHRWTEEIANAVISLQKSDGSWANAFPVMKEHQPIIATAFAVATLNVLMNRREK